MATEVLLIRHGQTDANVEGRYIGRFDEDINELGYHQAYRLSSKLAGLTIVAIYTSPLRRARTTATIIARPHQLAVEIIPDLNEIQLGDWQGMYQDEIQRKWPRLWRQSMIDPSELRLPNGESYREMTERAVRGFKKAVEAKKDSQIVIVTHDAIIRALIAHVLGVSNSIFRRIEVDEASLNLIRVGDQTQLLKLNDTSHL